MRTIAFAGTLVILLSAGAFPTARAAPRSDPAPVNFVANPGFELVQQWKPVGWKILKDKGFSLSDKAHTGQYCVALASPNDEWPSIEQEVKVLPGRTCLLSFWFRSEGDGGGKLSVQLIGEKWGALFEPRPTSEWQHCCYLITPTVPSFKLNLSNYHCKGMTFFIDDVSIDMNLSSLVELSAPPSETSSLTNNSPTFQWRPSMDRKYLSFDLLLSQSMKFPQQRTLVFPDLLEEVEYTPFEPLADGKWFWKIRFHYNNLQTGVTGDGESEPAFVVIRSDGKDYRAPRITSFGPTRIETPTGAEICVRFEDNPQGSGIDPSRVVLKIDGEDVTRQAQVSETGIVYRPARLDEAVHVGEVSIADRAGNEAAKKWWFIVKPKPKEGIVTWDPKQKTFLVDGKPFFPFGMYQFRRADPNPYFEYRSSGFNTTQFYDGQPIPGVEQAGAAGVKCFAVHPFNGGTENERNLLNEKVPFEDPTVAPPIAQRIFEGCNLPGLFCWSI